MCQVWTMSPVCPQIGVAFAGMAGGLRPPTGHVFRVDRARGPVWYAKYRLPDGRQVQKKLGPAWTGRVDLRPATSRSGWRRTGCARCSTRRGGARCRGSSGPARPSPTPRPSTCDTSSTIAAASRRRVRGYRSAIQAHLLPAFGAMPVEEVTTASDRGAGSRPFDGSRAHAEQAADPAARDPPAGAEGLRAAGNAAAEVERFPQRRSGDIEVFSPEEVWALVRAADSEQDGASS